VRHLGRVFKHFQHDTRVSAGDTWGTRLSSYILVELVSRVVKDFVRFALRGVRTQSGGPYVCPPYSPTLGLCVPHGMNVCVCHSHLDVALRYFNIIFGTSPRSTRFWTAFVVAAIRHKFDGLQDAKLATDVSRLSASPRPTAIATNRVAVASHVVGCLRVSVVAWDQFVAKTWGSGKWRCKCWPTTLAVGATSALLLHVHTCCSRCNPRPECCSHRPLTGGAWTLLWCSCGEASLTVWVVVGRLGWMPLPGTWQSNPAQRCESSVLLL